MPPPIDCETEALTRKLSSVSADLLSRGFAVIDDALSASLALTLRQSMETLRAGGGLRPHRFGVRAAGQVHILSKPHICEAEIDDEAVRNLAPDIVATLQGVQLQKAVRAAIPSLGVTDDAAGAAYKLQCNEGGCFPLHYDNAGPPSRRALTCLV